MNLLITIYHYLAALIKLLLLLILSPFFILYVLVKQWRYKSKFTNELKRSGMDRNSIKILKKELFKLSDLKTFIKSPKTRLE